MTLRGSILLTGANSGLGAAIAAHIVKTPDLARDYTGIYAVRNPDTASHLQEVLKNAPAEHRHEILGADLASVASTKSLAADINTQVAFGKLPPIRALILNAGHLDLSGMTLTDDGFDTVWQVNYLANFLLSLLLLQSIDKEHGRILIVGSWTHDVDDDRNVSAGSAPYKDPKWRNLFPGAEMLAKGQWSTPSDDAGLYPGRRRYGASKLCAIMHMHELASRIAKDPELSNISVLGLDPGGMGTNLARQGGFMMKLVMKIIPLFASFMASFDPNGTLRPTWKSAADVIRACFEISAPRGKALYLNGTEELETAKASQDPAKRKELWNYGLEASELRSEDTVLGDWM